MAKRRKQIRDDRQAAAEPPASAGEQIPPEPDDAAEAAEAAEAASATVAVSISERRRAIVVGAITVALVLVAGAGYLAWPRMMARLDAYLHAGDVSVPAAEEKIAALTTRLDTLAGALARLQSSADTSALATRLDELEARVGDLAEQGDALAGGRANISRRIDGLDAGLAALGRRLNDIDGRLVSLAAASGDGPAAAALAGRIANLERAVATAGKDTRVPALGSEVVRLGIRVKSLEGRFAALETSTPPASGPQPAMLLAVGQLRAALRGSGPYAIELDAVRAVAADDPGIVAALDALAARADSGVATGAALRARFAALAGPLVRAADMAEDGGWAERTIARLSQIVNVRRVGDIAGDSVEAIVARAEARLEADDLAAAAGEVERLSGKPAALAAAWLTDARARLAVGRALAVLDARAVAALGVAGSGG